MRRNLTAVAVIALTASITAQTPDKSQLPKGQMPELGRPTKVTDEVPLFNFDDYFTGKWTFEWDMPEGPLGQSGQVTGTTIYKVIEPGSPTRPIPPRPARAGRSRCARRSAIRRTQDDHAAGHRQPRLHLHAVGHDRRRPRRHLQPPLDSEPFTYNGQKVRIKQSIRTMSPFNYKVATTVSVDGGPFRNYGNPWWRKEAK